MDSPETSIGKGGSPDQMDIVPGLMVAVGLLYSGRTNCELCDYIVSYVAL